MMTCCCWLLMFLKFSDVRAGGTKADTGEAEARLLTFCRRFVANAAEDAWASHQAAVRTGASDIHTWDQVSLNMNALVRQRVACRKLMCLYLLESQKFHHVQNRHSDIILDPDKEDRAFELL